MTKYEKQDWRNKDDEKRIPISANHLNHMEDGIEGAYNRADELGASISAIAPYLAFVGHTSSSDIVAAAFGRQNETESIAIGKALKMYAKFKNDVRNTNFLDEYDNKPHNFTMLIENHKQELLLNSPINKLITGSDYAKSKLRDTKVDLPDIVLYEKGSTEYLDLNGASIVCEKPTSQQGSYSLSKDFTGDVLTVGITAKQGASGDGNALAARCTIPLLGNKPLPDLRGYRYLRVKFADNKASGFSNIQWLSFDSVYAYANIVIAGNSLSIPCKEENLVLTGADKVQDFFDIYATNPVKDNIEIQLNLLRHSDVQQTAVLNIEKIWISEA